MTRPPRNSHATYSKGFTALDLAKQTPAGLAIYHSNGAYKLPPHIAYFNRLALDVSARRIRRLIIQIGPRHGKSEFWSRYFPAWHIPTSKNDRVILTSYEATFAESWGRKARDVIHDVGFDVFGVSVSDSQGAGSWWDIEGYRGGMNTAGVGGPITGKGADILLIDDPIKNQREALSKTYRDHIWEWYKSVARTRLEPNGAIVIIMARWHQDDLVGRLLKGKDNDEFDEEDTPDRWAVVNLSPFAKENDILGRKIGEPLWKERYDRKALLETKNDLGSFWWNALYEGDPREREGGMFPRENFKIESAPPSGIGKLVRVWDFAGTGEEEDSGHAKFTSGGLFGYKDGVFYILDMKRKKLNPNRVSNLVKQTAVLDGSKVRVYIEQEPGSAGKHLINYYRRKVLKGYAVNSILPSGSKEVRADPLSDQAEAGNVVLIKGAWNEDFLEEASMFPNGEYTDQIDVSAYGYEILMPERIKIKAGMKAS